MIKMLFAFLVVFLSLFLFIPAYRKMCKKDKWGLFKIAVFSFICAVISIVVLSLIVIIF